MIEARPLKTIEQFSEAVRLQQEIWGFADRDLIPLRVFAVATKIGGQAFGGFDGDRMAGFCLAFPAMKPSGNMPYLHSQMLGVLKDYRNAGVGRILKLAQRQEALSRGLTLMEWTFDPLEIKNAYFNMERLGCVVRRFTPNVYGAGSSSFLHGALPTDRCVAEWWLGGPRATAITSGHPYQRDPIEARIRVPAEIEHLRHADPARAREIQKGVSDQFQEHLTRGLAVIGFERSDDAGTYLLGPWDSN